ncbi:hypothetical protein [Streptomyces oceani]|uniref:hypothetical protein n=1 Tax=Streptomyces oceani TaxID=1075402 RepID=UPI00147B3A0B|nr:hypothetical protein [Streptomyces oceani]
MDRPPPGIAVTQRMYELRKAGLTMPEVARLVSAEGYTLPGGRHSSAEPPRRKSDRYGR